MQKVLLSKLDGYSIRLCTSDDLPEVVAVNTFTLPEHYSDSFYYEILNEYPQTFIVTEFENKIVGYVMCRIEYGLSHLRRFALTRKGHIISIAALPDHRGKGIGTRMIQHALEGMKKNRCNEGYLEVRVSNKSAIELYNRIGFEITNTLHGYYKDGESAYLMAIQL
jgi:ribosomal-protein-alanine N-acetyltransferase